MQRGHTCNDYMMSIVGGRGIVDSTHVGNWSMFSNHWFNVNSYYSALKLNNVRKVKVVDVYAIRDIASGE